MGGLISGGTQMGLGIAQSDASRRVSDANRDATLEETSRLAADAELRGAQEVGKLRSQGSQLIARQRMAYANSGVDATQGTAASVQAATAAMSELDALTAENNAAREAWGYRKAGVNARNKWWNEQEQITNQGLGSILGGSAQASESAISFGAKYGG